MRTILIAFALGAVAVAGCSSSGTSGKGNAGGLGQSSSTGTTGGTSTSTSTGGGGGGGGDYCNIIRDAQSSINSLNNMNSAATAGLKISVIQQAIHKADDAAPAEVKPDWDKFRAAFDSFVAAIQSSGISLDDLSNPAKLQSLSPAQLQALQNAAQQIETSDLQADFTRIEMDVKSRCGVDISGS